MYWILGGLAVATVVLLLLGRMAAGRAARVGHMNGLRNLLFGDMNLEDWPPPHQTHADKPLSSFVEAREALAVGDRARAV